MDVEVLLPQRGMGMKEGTIVQWYVKVGDAVSEGDKLVGIESSKATDEILAPVSGIVTRIDYNEDEEVEVGEVLAVISTVEGSQLPSSTSKTSDVQSNEGRALKQASTEVQISQFRRVTAERMLSSLQTTAQLTLHTSVDVLATVKRRDLLKVESGITYLDIFVRIAAGVLRKHPIFSATWEENRLVLNPAVNIGIAVDTDEGLVVPVIKNADLKTLDEIHFQVTDLVEKAQKGGLTIDDLSGGTFTVTNLGKSCVEHFTPILNPPETGILGIGRIRNQVVPVGDEICIRPILGLSLTFDHRIVDGKPAADFLGDICAALETADF